MQINTISLGIAALFASASAAPPAAFPRSGGCMDITQYGDKQFGCSPCLVGLEVNPGSIQNCNIKWECCKTATCCIPYRWVSLNILFQTHYWLDILETKVWVAGICYAYRQTFQVLCGSKDFSIYSPVTRLLCCAKSSRDIIWIQGFLRVLQMMKGHRFISNRAQRFNIQSLQIYSCSYSIYYCWAVFKDPSRPDFRLTHLTFKSTKT